ncbi:MAG TPA: glycoside hydrolase family 88 protein [Steroidobacteraceae bacterium]|jgi:rhamnogalacturonyl hydrolase YesR|nr:glycoside hydrolase family 88 protein [Steroidobacteraceae bacterium]
MNVFWKRGAASAVLCVWFAITTASAGAQIASRKDVLKLAARVADWQLARLGATQGVTSHAEETANPRSWQQGAFWVGMTHLADATGEKRFADAIILQGEANQWTPGKRTYHADDHVIAQSYLWAARHGEGDRATAPLRATFDAILANPAVAHLSFVPSSDYESTPCLRRWCWCDALFMSPPAWVELSQWTKDPRYTEFAMAEFWATTDFLYDPVEKLFFRDSRFFERRDEKGRKQFWSRGNGWVFAGIANILDALPQDSPHRPRLEKLFREMAAKIKAVQKSDGYWPPSLLAPENSPPESSGTGFYVYGLAWGVNHGLLDAGEYWLSIESGWNALTRAVAKDGRLGWVQQVSDRPESVAETDTQYYGVGAFLLAASAVAKLDATVMSEKK